jgi:hypothetical protein
MKSETWRGGGMRQLVQASSTDRSRIEPCGHQTPRKGLLSAERRTNFFSHRFLRPRHWLWNLRQRWFPIHLLSHCHTFDVIQSSKAWDTNVGDHWTTRVDQSNTATVLMSFNLWHPIQWDTQTAILKSDHSVHHDPTLWVMIKNVEVCVWRESDEPEVHGCQ